MSWAQLPTGGLKNDRPVRRAIGDLRDHLGRRARAARSVRGENHGHFA